MFEGNIDKGPWRVRRPALALSLSMQWWESDIDYVYHVQQHEERGIISNNQISFIVLCMTPLTKEKIGTNMGKRRWPEVS